MLQCSSSPVGTAKQDTNTLNIYQLCTQLHPWQDRKDTFCLCDLKCLHSCLLFLLVKLSAPKFVLLGTVNLFSPFFFMSLQPYKVGITNTAGNKNFKIIALFIYILEATRWQISKLQIAHIIQYSVCNWIINKELRILCRNYTKESENKGKA